MRRRLSAWLACFVLIGCGSSQAVSLHRRPPPQQERNAEAVSESVSEAEPGSVSESVSEAESESVSESVAESGSEQEADTVSRLPRPTSRHCYTDADCTAFPNGFCGVVGFTPYPRPRSCH